MIFARPLLWRVPPLPLIQTLLFPQPYILAQSDGGLPLCEPPPGVGLNRLPTANVPIGFPCPALVVASLSPPLFPVPAPISLTPGRLTTWLAPDLASLLPTGAGAAVYA